MTTKTNVKKQKILYSADQAAEFLGITARTIRAYAARDESENVHLKRVAPDSPYYLGDSIIVFEHDELVRFKKSDRKPGRPAGSVNTVPINPRESTREQQKVELMARLARVITAPFSLRYESGKLGRGWYLRITGEGIYYFAEKQDVLLWLDKRK